MKQLKSLLLTLLVGSMLLCSCSESGQKPGDSAGDTTDAPTEAITTEKTDNEVYGILPSDDENIDFILNVPADREVRILQMTDTQITNPQKARNQNRINQITGAFFGNGCFDDEKKTYRHMDEAVANMGVIDLIVVTGDMIYGETDDSGEIWKSFVAKMDSYKIPWTVVWGNHDNESAKGVNWQIQQLLDSDYAVFERGDVTGNCNFNIAVKQGGAIKYMLYMLDTNGCKEIPTNPGEGVMPSNVDLQYLTQKQGIYQDQMDWFENTMKAINEKEGKNIPVMQFFHIPPSMLNKALSKRYSFNGNGTLQCNDGKDFGFIGEYSTSDVVDTGNKFFNLSKKMGVTNMFFGHYHDCNGSVVYEGIRMTYGSKTGTHSYHDYNLLGSTQIVINAKNKVEVTHAPSQFIDDNK